MLHKHTNVSFVWARSQNSVMHPNYMVRGTRHGESESALSLWGYGQTSVPRRVSIC
jgi:hypothetical protein